MPNASGGLQVGLDVEPTASYSIGGKSENVLKMSFGLSKRTFLFRRQKFFYFRYKVFFFLSDKYSEQQKCNTLITSVAFFIISTLLKFSLYYSIKRIIPSCKACLSINL